MIKDLAVKHSYYCSDVNYYNNDTHFEFESWGDFISEMGKSDMDYNLLFRWDISRYDDDTKYHMELFYMQQRKGKFICLVVNNLKDSDEESIRGFLCKYWEYIKELWKPISI